jgi:hypothetical protein
MEKDIENIHKRTQYHKLYNINNIGGLKKNLNVITSVINKSIVSVTENNPVLKISADSIWLKN